jgi:SNF2 family DNA or RNA helicase
VQKELPPKQRNNLYVEMEPKDIQEYTQHLKDLFKKWKAHGKPTVAEMPKIQKFLSTKKLPRLIEMVDELLENDRHVLIFSVYLEPLKYLLKHYGKDAALVIGELNSKDRQSSIDKLSNGDARVGLFSIGAGSMGIDGLQHQIDTVIFIDMWWTPAIHEQAEDRVHRIGQNNHVQIFYMMCEGTIDEYMRELLDEKLKIIETVVDGQILTAGKANKSFFKEFVNKLKTNYTTDMEALDTKIVEDIEQP